MTIINIYEPSMQSALEYCFKACVETLGWEYQSKGRHLDMVSIEDTYMQCGCFWCLFNDDVLVGMVAARCIGSDNNTAELKCLYVLPGYQGNGYGGLLFKYALSYAKAQGI